MLAAIGTDVALMHLDGIARKVKFKGLRERRRRRSTRWPRARARPEQLADRLVPDFGLDADGSLGLDYGPRRFTVGFDEPLKPYVVDEDGKRPGRCRSRARRTTPSWRRPPTSGSPT